MFAWIEASAVSGVAFGLSDIIAQCGERMSRRMKKRRPSAPATPTASEEPHASPPSPPLDETVTTQELDYFRLARFTGIGALYGPCLYYYYRLLEKYFPGNVWAKILIGAVFYNPIVLSLYISLNQVIKDRGAVNNVWITLKDQFPRIVIAGTGYWLVIDFINFSYVPVVHQVLVTRACGILFDIYLTHASNRRSENETVVEKTSSDPKKIELKEEEEEHEKKA